MAKKQISNYKFSPGIIPPTYGEYPIAVDLIEANKDFIIAEVSTYLEWKTDGAAGGAPTTYPNAYTNLEDNKEFIKEEIAAWIQLQVDGNFSPFAGYNYSASVRTKYKNDVGKLIDAWLLDFAGGGNADTIRIARNIYWLNGDEQSISPTQEAAVYTQLKNLVGTYVVAGLAYTSIQNIEGQILGASGEPGATARVNALIDIVINLITGGLPTLPAFSYNYDALYVGYTYDASKCERDVGYVIDSYVYDLTYGGNSLTYYTASRYYVNGVIQVNNSDVEVQTQTFVKSLIVDYILLKNYHANYQTAVEQTVTLSTVEAGSISEAGTLADVVIDTIDIGLSELPAVVVPDSQNGGLLPNAVALLESNKRFIQEEAIAYIQYNVDSNISPFIYYTYNSEKCRRDVSYILEGYISDLKYGGNRQTVFNASKYWENGVAQVDGSREPELSVHEFIYGLIENYIWVNIAFTARQNVVFQVTDNANPAEAIANTRLKELNNTILDVIEFGPTYLPARVTNLGSIKIPGYFKLKDILLITNTSRNIILYNFADPSLAAEVTYSEEYDSDFGGALYGVDKITTVTLTTDTTNMMVTDNIQIFVEGKEQAVRLNPIATDAMERMKVGIPQSMLDADFEYGLQPTKWQAIALLRNYPAIYEIPGSDIAVTGVTTDASTGTSGVGASLITVTTLSSHGLAVGNPITIKALANSISGFSRAEGSFLVFGVPTGTTFTYYAKSKVGTSDGQQLSSTYTQLRKGGFYTNAAVGSPTFNVLSAGSSGTITTSLITASGSTSIGFSGSAPPVGAPLSGTGIASGAQVTAVTGGGGTVASTTLTTNAGIGDTVITVDSTTGLGPGLVFDRGDGVSVTITDITSNDVTLSSALTSAIVGTNQTYSSRSQDTTSGSGSSAVFSVSRAGGTYSVTITNPGQAYVTSDTITILGTNLGGTSPTNDATITVDSASATYTVASLNNGTLVPGSGYTDAFGVATTSGGAGTGLTVDIATTTGAINAVTIATSGSGYTVGELITITGGDSNATINVLTVNTGGAILTASIAGTPITAPTKNFISAITISDATTSQIASGNTGITYSAIATIEATFTSNHGFLPGSSITVYITSSDTGAQLAAGPFFVEQCPSATTLRYTARAPGAITNTLVGQIYARPDSYFVHRPFDGGVQLGTGGPSHGVQAIRMSKKYIRYQSGKGVMYNTGALFAPSYDLRSLTSTGTIVGSVVTVVTDDTDHGCQVGAQITISGVSTTGYNGVYTVASVTDERTFTFVSTKVLGATTAILGNPCQMAVRNWHGATIRAGIFDEQNGMFWQYDGIRMAVGRRSSTFQIAGTLSVNANSNQITGSNTRFTQQLEAGDRIVIRGMTHVVSSIASDTSMTVTPDFRGTSNVSGVKATKTIDIIVPQEDWNLDSLNGAGTSGYNIDVTKMQMIGLQHTWYGAGFIDFMLRGADGNYCFAHRFRNSNVNTEAYMRTGNQPVRYEVINEGAKSKLSEAINSSVTSIPLDNTYWFPDSGTVIIDNELIRYTGRTETALTGCTRGTSLTQFVAGSSRTFTGGSAASHLIRAGVILVSNTVTPIISHWGSAFMIDGQFDSDRGYIFNYAATGVSASTDKETAFLIRLAPSVSNAQTGDLGERELLNRAQLLLSEIAIASDTVAGGGAIVVEGVLNPSNYPEDPTKITWNGLSTQAAGGQPSFAQIASGGSVTWGGNTSTTTATVQGAFTTTLTAKSFAPATQSPVAISFGSVTQNVTAKSFAAATSTTYNRAINSARSDFLITTAQYDALTTPLAAGDSLFAATYVVGSQRISSVTRAYITLAGTSYTRIVMTSNGSSSSPAAATNGGNDVVLTITSSVAARYNSAISTARSDFLITQTQYASLTLTTGDVLSATTYLVGGQSISSLTANYTTIAGTAYARIVMSSAGSVTSPTGSGNDITVTSTSAATALYGSALSTSRTDFLITDTAYDASGIATSDILSVAGAGTTLASVQITGTAGQFSCTSTTLYVGETVTISGTFGGTGSITGYSNPTTYRISATNGSTTFTLTTTGGTALTTTAGTPTGLTYTLNAFISGSQTISSITRSYISISSVSYTRIVMSAVANVTSVSGSSNDITVTVQAAGTAASYVGTSYLFFTSATWLASGATIGTRIASAVTSFPANTAVNAVSTRTYGATTVYRVSFTQASNTTIAAAATITFQFGAFYALPGEQVFSFISNPGDTSGLLLENLKELTSTAIGGRGAFPNGPDVLAINVYKVAGTATPVNIILRWGEAQA